MGRYEILRRYSRRILNSGYYDSNVLFASRKTRHTTEDAEHVIGKMTRQGLFRKRKVTHELVWSIYAEVQKEKYHRKNPHLHFPPNTTRCYICSNLVGKDNHPHYDDGEWDVETPKDGIHSWSISHIISYPTSLCNENFNFRICCRECNVRIGTSNPYHTALSLDYNFVSEGCPSLAIFEGIESLEYAFRIYFQYYKGVIHGV